MPGKRLQNTELIAKTEPLFVTISGSDELRRS